MKILHIIIWTAFIAVICWNVCQRTRLNCCCHKDFEILKLEFADSSEGKALLTKWSETPASCTAADEGTLLHQAQINTYVDFVFIFSYVGVMIFLSYSRMQREGRKTLNNLLRLNFFLAIIAGLLDVIENFILLCDMHHYYPGKCYCPAVCIATVKFVLCGWIILVWLVSLCLPRRAR